jgi:DNA repair exonuclease SbcCD nuclease subunit
VFDQVRKQLEADKSILSVGILGDISDRKDRHDSVLVNLVATEIKSLAKIRTVWILKGNHDHPDGGVPYWEFLNNSPIISYIVQPVFSDLLGGSWLLPYSKQPHEDWRGLDFTKGAFIFMHQTVGGAVMANGTKLDSSEVYDFPKSTIVYSGDVHVPQKVGQVTYVGAPYPIRFGDSYAGRMLIVGKGVELSIPVTSLRKVSATVRSVDDFVALNLHEEDQVKLTLQLTAKDAGRWAELQAEIANEAKKIGVGVSSLEVSIDAYSADSIDSSEASNLALSDEDMLIEFCASTGVEDSFVEAGLAFLRAAG